MGILHPSFTLISFSLSANTSSGPVMVDPHKVMTVEVKSQLTSHVMSDEEEDRQDGVDEERYELAGQSHNGIIIIAWYLLVPLSKSRQDFFSYNYFAGKGLCMCYPSVVMFENCKNVEEFFLCFQKLVSGELHTFYFGRFPSLGIEYMLNIFHLLQLSSITGLVGNSACGRSIFCPDDSLAI